MGLLDFTRKFVDGIPHSYTWKKYQNNKRYGTYEITKTHSRFEINEKFAKCNAKTYYKQYDNSFALLYQTDNPLIFFYRYDFAVKRLIDIIYMQRYADFLSILKPEVTVENLLNDKQKLVGYMIDRASGKLENKLKNLKSTKIKLTNIDKFEQSFIPFLDEISPENIQHIKQIADKLRSNCQ